MKIKQSSKSSLFLIELIIAIFFFIIAATICIQLFVKSYTISNETISINHAVLWTQNLSEIFTCQTGNYQILKEFYSSRDYVDQTSLPADCHILLLFDSDWQPTNTWEETIYCVLSVYSENQNFHYQDIYILHTTPNIDDLSNPKKLLESDYLISHQCIQQFVPQN